MRHLRRLALLAFLAALAPVLGALLWMVTGPSLEARSAALLAGQATAWEDPDTRARTTAELRRMNPEWDFMRRTFLVLAAADRALAHPEEADRWLALADDVIDSTLADEAAFGHRHFLLDYAGAKPWVDPARRSLFVDGEIALMLGARRLVRDDPRLAGLHRSRVARVAASFDAAPAGLPESYPDEAWLFCVTNALVGVRMADVLDGTDHQALVDGFLARVPGLLHPASGLLNSEVTSAGAALDGPEGSSLWLVVTNLAVLDPTLANAQYDGAVRDLYHEALGLGWASEWGPTWRGPVDVDSGPIVPILDASPSSSGFALLATRAFRDDRRHAALARSLRAADLLLVLDPRLAELAGNPMGDVILLYALGHGPLWDRLRGPST
ncbi:MAG: hypothetical protein KC656_02600 [Myxococcales bacterium]|nr:hypothetical protein [Myxococcales bacterium]